jgi:DNA repair protein RadC
MQTTTYALTRAVPILSHTERTYTLKLRDLPYEERPRERLAALGPSALSAAELLAVVLSTGTKKEDVLSMTRRIMKEYGEQGIVSQQDPVVLAKDLSIPEGKALQIIAAFELGRRSFAKSGGSAPTLRTANEVYEYVQDMRALTKEHLRGLYLNAHYKVIHDEVVSIGTLDANIIHPRDVFRPALEYSAAAVILVHNHPSGVPHPSAADLEVTEQLVAAGRMLGIELVDHLIVTHDAFASVPASYHD